MMQLSYLSQFPSVEDLKLRSKRRIPKFAWEYLSGGCNEDVNLSKNTRELRNIELLPFYLREHNGASLSTQLLGQTYDAPFGVAPIGLQGLIWPGSPKILAEAASQHNIPFILSTVTTTSIEDIARYSKGKAWFQLYHPAEEHLTDKIIKRLEHNGYEVLVLLSDVPSFGFRPRDIRNGLSMPPRMNIRNVWQAICRPEWSFRTLKNGIPDFATLRPYIPEGLDMGQLGAFMNKTFEGRLTEAKVARLRDKWKGKLILKGVASVEDARIAMKLGLDGVIVSNHGGRQLDAGQSSVTALQAIAPVLKHKIPVMMDSGIESGPDIARALAAGADFVFLGRTFMYAVAALGETGGQHVMSVLKVQLKQVMDQLCCASTFEIRQHLAERHQYQSERDFVFP